MSLLLTDRQKSDLNNAIFDYLSSQSEVFTQSALVFKQEAGIVNADPSAKGLLAKKWISVVRLQKKIMELEVKLEQAHRSEGGVDAAAVAVTAIGISGDIRQLPKPPAKHCLTGHRLSVTALATHPVYSLLASGSEDCTIRLWDHETAQYERTLKGHTGPVTSVAFDSKGLLLASSSADMSAKLWDMSSYACTKTFKGHDHTVSSVLFLPGDDRLATCSRDQTIKLWDLSSGYCVRTFSGHTDWVKCVSISVDGVYIASGSSDQSIMIWELASGKLVQVLIIVFPLAKVSADESLPLLLIQTLRGHEHVVEAVSYGRKPVDAATIVALSSPVRSEIMVSSLALLLHQAFIHHTSSMHVLLE